MYNIYIYVERKTRLQEGHWKQEWTRVVASVVVIVRVIWLLTDKCFIRIMAFHKCSEANILNHMAGYIHEAELFHSYSYKTWISIVSWH